MAYLIGNVLLAGFLTTGSAMGIFELSVAEASNIAGTIREIRQYGDLGIADIRLRIGTSEPVISVSTDGYPIEMDMVEGSKHQHELVLAAYEALVALGNSVSIQYKVAEDSEPELVDLVVAKNLMKSELNDLDESLDHI